MVNFYVPYPETYLMLYSNWKHLHNMAPNRVRNWIYDFNLKQFLLRRYMVHIDENGDAEGNYTVLTLKPNPINQTEYGLYPVAMFDRLQSNIRNLPVINHYVIVSFTL